MLSPNGERIAFVKSDGSPPRDLYVMNADGTGGARAIASHPRTTGDDAIRALAWSPDAARIAYLRGASPAIHVVDARGGTPFPLPQTGDPTPFSSRLEWSPDDTELLRIRTTVSTSSGATARTSATSHPREPPPSATSAGSRTGPRSCSRRSGSKVWARGTSR